MKSSFDVKKSHYPFRPKISTGFPKFVPVVIIFENPAIGYIWWHNLKIRVRGAHYTLQWAFSLWNNKNRFRGWGWIDFERTGMCLTKFIYSAALSELLGRTWQFCTKSCKLVFWCASRSLDMKMIPWRGHAHKVSGSKWVQCCKVLLNHTVPE